MIQNIVLITFSFLLIIISILFFIRNKIFIYNKKKWIRRVPITLTLSMGLFIFIETVYFDHKRDAQIEHFDILKLVATKIDTSIDSKEILQVPVDLFTLKKEDSVNHLIKQTDSVSNEMATIKNYLSEQNIFSKVSPEIQDSINTTYRSLKEKQQILKTVDLSHGFVYGGKGSEEYWIQDNFENRTHPTYKIPKRGDILKCIKPIFIREGAASPAVSKKGWVNQRLKGILQQDSFITVKNVIKLPCDYIWIEF